MKKLTKAEAIASHRKMWRWIAEETFIQERKVRKWEYFDHFSLLPTTLENRLQNSCYCCEHDRQQESSTPCENCPLEWGSDLDQLMCVAKREYNDDLGLYQLWSKSFDYKDAAKLAAQIAELPEREVMENDT